MKTTLTKILTIIQASVGFLVIPLYRMTGNFASVFLNFQKEILKNFTFFPPALREWRQTALRACQEGQTCSSYSPPHPADRRGLPQEYLRKRHRPARRRIRHSRNRRQSGCRSR